jgi:hypothetical protein
MLSERGMFKLLKYLILNSKHLITTSSETFGTR